MRATQDILKPLTLIAAVLASLFSLACEGPADVHQPQSYSRDGISFDYPRNWSVTEDVVQPGDSQFRYLFVESPGSAIVIVQRHKPASDQSVEEFAADFQRNAAKETKDLARIGSLTLFNAGGGSTGSVHSVVAGTLREGVEQHFSVSAAGEQVPHMFRAFKVDTGTATTFLLVQSSTEDWNLVAPGFDLIFTSFKAAWDPAPRFVSESPDALISSRDPGVQIPKKPFREAGFESWVRLL